MRLSLFRILGEAYATWREFRRDAEGHAGGWMWLEGSWEGKRGHLSMALVVALCVPLLNHRKVARTINLAEARFWQLAKCRIIYDERSKGAHVHYSQESVFSL